MSVVTTLVEKYTKDMGLNKKGIMIIPQDSVETWGVIDMFCTLPTKGGREVLNT